MRISGRNQFRGTIKALAIEGLMASVTVAISGGNDVHAVITREAVEELGLGVGDEVTAIVKASSVLIAK